MKRILPLLFIIFSVVAFKGLAQPALFQNFNSGLGTWTNTVSGGGGGWAITNGNTSTQFGTVSGIAPHSRYVMVNEALLGGSSSNHPATLTSPSFSLMGMTAPTLAFDQVYFQVYNPSTSDTETAWIEISTNGGASYQTIDTIQYNGAGTSNPEDPAWQTTFVSLGSITPSANCIVKFVYTDMGGQLIGIALDNIMVYDAANADLALSAVSPAPGSASDYFRVGTSANFSGTVTNYSNSSVSSFTASYVAGTGSVVNNTISGVTVPAMGTATFNYTTPYTVSAAQQYPVTATGDNNLLNDTVATSVQGVKFMPKKRVLFEEATGTWCGYCVRGIIYMDSLWKNFRDNVSIISVHNYNNYDPMSIENASTKGYDTAISSMISGFPSMVIDRSSVDDPSGALTDLANDSSEFGFFNMGVTATTSGGMLRTKVTVEPALNLTGNYNLQIVVEEDSVHGTSAGYAQHNYYGNVIAGGVPQYAAGVPLSGCGYNFDDSTTDITAGHIKFPFVARWTFPSDVYRQPNGIPGSLPTTMTAGSVYTYSDSVAIPSDWVAGNLRVVAFVINDNSSDANYSHVLNSVNSSSTPYSYINDAVKNVNASVSELKLFPNPANDMAHVQFVLSTASNVHFSVYDAVGHLVFSAPSEMMNAGGQQINFSTANYSSGIYNIVVRTDNGVVTQRLSVVR